MEWNWAAWVISVAAVVFSAAIAALEGNWRKRPGLDMGFVDHGGMWGDLLLLPVANAAIVPHLAPGVWIVAAIALATMASILVHIHWYRGNKRGPHRLEHMWPSRLCGPWWRDLSKAGWAHVLYVIGELSLLVGFALYEMPGDVIALVAIIFSLHVPLGLLQPRWFLTGEIASPRKQPLLVPCLTALWLVTFLKS